MDDKPTVVAKREEVKGPKGIGFYNIKSGETHYARLEPQIQAFINSSNLGINASRGQDFGWRLHPEWVEKVKAFRQDEVKMERLLDKNGDNEVTTAQVLYAVYGAELRAAAQRAKDNENPFEEDYLQAISGRPDSTVKVENGEMTVPKGDGETSISKPEPKKKER